MMSSDSMQQSSGSNEKMTRRRPDGSLSRRRVLKTFGVAGAVALAGCTGGGGSNESDGESSGNGENGGATTQGNVDSVTLGIVTPLSGAFSTGGEDIRDGVELAAQDAMDKGLISNVDTIADDSQTAPSEARSVAQSHIDNGANFLIGTLSGATSEAVSQLGRSEQTIVVGSSGNLESSGPKCHPYWFPLNCSGRTMNMAGLGYALQNDLGESVYQISSDFLWPQDMVEQNKEYVIPEFGGEHLGNQFVPFGNSDFSQSLTSAEESGADIVCANAYGNDLIRLVNQAWEFGLPQSGTIIAIPQSDISIAEGYTPEARASDNVIHGMEWYHGFSSDATQQYTEKFEGEYERSPAWTSALTYNHTMTYIEAVSEVGTTNSDEVANQMEGMDLSLQFWGRGNSKIRACNHRPTNPSMTLKGLPESEVEGRDYFEVQNILQDQDLYMVPCDETGCSMESPFGEA